MSLKSLQSLRPSRWVLLAAAVAAASFAGVAQAGAAGSDTECAKLAAELVARAQIHRGVCAVLGCNKDIAIELARASELLVHVRDPNAAAIAELRKDADEAGFDVDRIAAETGGLDKLPYADNLLDVVVVPEANAQRLHKLALDEVLRVLRPKGRALIVVTDKGDHLKSGLDKLTQRAKQAGYEPIESWADSSATIVRLVKPAPDGADDWPHWEHGPDNNPVSGDRVIKAPYLTQFLDGPLYIGMPSVTTAAGGRTFLAVGHIAHHFREWNMLNKLIARNGYNGTVLWQRDLPKEYMVHRSAFYATEDTFHMIDGDRCLLLDAHTGEERGEIRVPGVDGEWKWMAFQDGVLYVLAGKRGPGAKTIKGDRAFGGWSWADLSVGYYQQPRVPWGFGHTLAAYDLDNKRTLWKHREQKPIDSRALAVGQGRVFLYCPEKHLRCVDAATGQVVWTNDRKDTLELIEEPGRGLSSTPGFRSVCLAVYTPKALIIQGQTRMNVAAISTDDGSLLWTKRKITNNPNAIYVDGRVVLGVGPGGTHVAIDPVTGEVLEDFGFRKLTCTRLTASTDSFFCRGEGTLRFDRQTKKVLIDGGIRPACNDGAIPANGMLYLGPWQCDCNLSLIGACGRCSAGDFRFDHIATEDERLQLGQGDVNQVASLETTPEDWPTYRANNRRSAGTAARLARSSPARRGSPDPAALGEGLSTPPRAVTGWQYVPRRPLVPTAPTSAGGLVFVAGQDGKIRAIDAAQGTLRWQFATPSAIKVPPTIAQGRAYFGCSDGYVYALEAATGRLLWRFRAAPVERHIMLYGYLASTWPVNSGVLVDEGVAYFAAGIIDQDGTYVYALDAVTGKIKWQNNSSGHLNPDLRKGVSAQGCLAVQGNQLLLAGGNQVSPARFDLATGKCLAAEFSQGQPKANAGRFVGALDDEHAIAGGRILYSDPRNVATKGSFILTGKPRPMTLNYGGIPPAWSENTLAMVNFRHGKITCCDTARVAAQIEKGFPAPTTPRPQRWRTLADLLVADGAARWQSDLAEPNKFEALSLAVCPASVVAVVQYQHRVRAHPQWFVAALNADDGTPYWFWRHELPSEPLPGGLLVDRKGRVVVTLLNGNVLCLAPAVSK